MPAAKVQYPRGSGGSVLYPGTQVQVHGLKSGAAKIFNDAEGECRVWSEEHQRMHVKLSHDGSIKAFKAKNLRKVLPPVAEGDGDDPDLEKVLNVFQRFDVNGDGVLDTEEFTACLKAMGLSGAVMQSFLRAVDKDGDGEIRYEEFAKWALGTNEQTGEVKVNTYFGDTTGAQVIDDIADAVGDDDEEPDADAELTLKDLEKLCHGKMPPLWPAHGLKVVNNMRLRFPDYPIEGIMFMMQRNDFIGGTVIRAIRATNTREVDPAPDKGVKCGSPGAFPAWYINQAPDQLLVYEEAGPDFSFRNMRDRNKVRPVGNIPPGERFEVLE
ncbi:unnamed protein product, partial [Polarella glacialis]